MRPLFVLVIALFITATSLAGDPSPKDVVARLYEAHRSKHDPLDEPTLLDRYFDPTLLKLYLRDRREAKGEVGRLDGDPLYNAQDFEIKEFSVSAPELTGGVARVTVSFKNFGKSTRLVFVLGRTAHDWKISDIRYDDGSSLRQILERKL